MMLSRLSWLLKRLDYRERATLAPDGGLAEFAMITIRLKGEIVISLYEYVRSNDFFCYFISHISR